MTLQVLNDLMDEEEPQADELDELEASLIQKDIKRLHQS